MPYRDPFRATASRLPIRRVRRTQESRAPPTRFPKGARRQSQSRWPARSTGSCPGSRAYPSASSAPSSACEECHCGTSRRLPDLLPGRSRSPNCSSHKDLAAVGCSSLPTHRDLPKGFSRNEPVKHATPTVTISLGSLCGNPAMLFEAIVNIRDVLESFLLDWVVLGDWRGTL